MFLMRLLTIFCGLMLCLIIRPVYAFESDTLSVMKPNDLALGCHALSSEASLMSEIIYTTRDIQDDVDIRKQGITALGALGSFVAGTATGGLGFAAAGYLLKENAGQDGRQAALIQNLAAQRRALLTGMFMAKNCYGPIEHVFVSPADLMPATRLAATEPAAGELQRYNQ